MFSVPTSPFLGVARNARQQRLKITLTLLRFKEKMVPFLQTLQPGTEGLGAMLFFFLGEGFMLVITLSPPT